MSAIEPDIPLAATIRALRDELMEAVAQAQGEDLRFALGPVELELQLAVSKEAGAEAGIRFWVVSVGAKGARSDATTHTVRLTLTPVSESGDVLVSSRIARPD